MDTALLAVAAAVFTCGLIVGYLIRDGISRRRRAKAKISRSFFMKADWQQITVTLNICPREDKIANPQKNRHRKYS